MILGLTGNIAAGKSRVAREFTRLGATVVDADLLAREAVEPGTVTLERLVDRFGGAILNADGQLDRPTLAAIVFADEGARADLNAIVHPAIAALSRQRLSELRSDPGIPLIVYDAPLLLEAGADKRVDQVLVIRIDESVQRQRLQQRDQLSAEEVQQRIDAQMSQEEKLKRADYVIDNSGSVADMRSQVEALWRQLTGEVSSA